MSNTSENTCRSPVIVALDYPSAAQALELVDQLAPSACRLKVGKQLFTLAGPDFVRELCGRGFDVFLDLKFHDIPNTVASACAAAAELGVWMVNVHASGGRRMMQAAREAVPAGDGSPLLIAVSVLTSMTQDDLSETGVSVPIAEQVAHLSALAYDCGLDGMVCSAEEAGMLRDRFGEQFHRVTPGIRTAGSDAGDQRRVMTPEKAMAAGSDYLVIGRSITAAADPAAALSAINASLGVNA
ncbi:orotidine-5'-phosphate decarboxylase [Granulosicoccaceae sp. 1_MG-2023]|nr:orotidine-5'-phosphate decarboxylase [Granulosicoccaceae sp. 1_MG-2023]